MSLEKALGINVHGQGTTKDDLALVLDGVVENIQTRAVSESLKARNGSGHPAGGTVEYKRFANAVLEDYGTARSGYKGANVVAKPIKILIDTDKEIIEEFAIKDVELYGIKALVERRKTNIERRLAAFLDREFFARAVADGTAFDRNGETDIVKLVDAMIVQAKSTTSDFIDGIDAEDLAFVVSPEWRKALKNHLNELPQGTPAENGLIGTYDSVDFHESHRLGTGVNGIIMLKEAVAQPYLLSEYGVEKIPFVNAVALESYISKGDGVLAPEAVLYDREAGSF